MSIEYLDISLTERPKNPYIKWLQQVYRMRGKDKKEDIMIVTEFDEFD
jgi:hypothetical protein